MKSDQPAKTPLLELLRILTPDQREEFAAMCDTSVLYLYQIAGCNRKSTRAYLAYKIAKATEQLNMLYGTQVISLETLACMCNQEGGCEV